MRRVSSAPRRRENNTSAYSATIAFAESRIADLLCSAYEGGSNYWACQDDDKPSPYRVQGEPGLRDDFDFVTITDLEDDGKQYRLDCAALARGIACMPTTAPGSFADLLRDDGDASTGDAFLQCCLFGEVIYG